MALATVVLEDGQVVEKVEWLIRPPEMYFNPYNTKIHGIREDDVRDKPEFCGLWGTVRCYFERNIVLAHNATFDMGVLGRTLDTYKIAYPEVKFACTRLISRHTWPGFASYSLVSVADMLGIRFQHHDAIEDAVVCSEIALRACQETGAASIDELLNRLGIAAGALTHQGYCRPERAEPRRGSLRHENPRFETGSRASRRVTPAIWPAGRLHRNLQVHGRKEAMQRVVDVGGRCGTSVTCRTDYLVLGDLDFHYYKFTDGEKSQKLRDAESLVAAGSGIEIVPEADFLKLLKS